MLIPYILYRISSLFVSSARGAVNRQGKWVGKIFPEPLQALGGNRLVGVAAGEEHLAG
jgi:hypothetical protein